MPRLNVVVEGQTEETFVRDVLANHLALRGVYAVARSVETSRTRLKIWRGGMSTYAKAKGDIERWMKQDTNAYLTTMFDLYALPADFPNMAKRLAIADPYKRAELLEQGMAADINRPNLIPYIQLHEFEALLFSAPAVTDAALTSPRIGSRLGDLNAILNGVASPEHIDEGDDSAPSKRIMNLYPAYRKSVFGPLITERIGIDTIRQKCKHFHAWVQKLEALR